jgi:hypothetical protein
MSRKFIQQYADAKGAIIEKPGVGILLAAGTTVPTDGTAGFAPGCVFIDEDSTTDGSMVFINEGTSSSCDFNGVGTNNSALFELGFSVFPHATATEWDLWVAPFACQVTAIKYVPSTLQGGAMTATVVKASGTDTPVKTTTPMVTADVIDLNAGAYTVVTPTLTATTADLILAAGNRISLDFSAAPTAAVWALSISLKRL